MRVGSIATLGSWVARLAIVALPACSGGSHAIPRVLDDVPTEGAFVSPHQYEQFVQGELAFARGDLDAAAAAFAGARLGPEDDALIVVRLAEVERARGRPERAEALVREALALDATSEGAFLVRGAMAEDAGRTSDAREAYERAIACAPRSDRGPLALAALLARGGDEDAAMAVLEALAARAPSTLAADSARFELALARRVPERVEDAARALLGRNPGARARVLTTATSLVESDPGLALALAAALPEEDALPVRLEAWARLRQVDALEAALVWVAESPERIAALWLLAAEPARALDALDGAGDTPPRRCLRRRALQALGREADARAIEPGPDCAIDAAPREHGPEASVR